MAKLQLQKTMPLQIKTGSFWNEITTTVNPLPVHIEEQIKLDHCTYVQIEEGAQKLFNYILRYVAMQTQLNSYTINTASFAYDDDSEDENEDLVKKGQRTVLKLGLGLHTLVFESHQIKILYSFVGKPQGSSSSVSMKESIVLIIEELGKQEILQHFCNFVVNFFEKTSADFINVYQYNAQHHYWHVTSNKVPRSMESIVLSQEVKDTLTKDIDEFVSKEAYNWYKAHGVPYKRSYLLFGPPGSGKSSIIQAIAGKYKRNICFVQPMKEKFTDEEFSNCIQVAPKKALIVLEDIDTYFRKDRKTNHKTCPLTFSGLLNGLDGVGNTDGQIFIITTNFIDRLDDALLRSGRVDLKIEFSMMTLELAFDMFLKFYPNEIAWASIFKDNLEKNLKQINRNLCMADLQQHFIAHRLNSPQQASEDFGDLTGEEFTRLSALAEKISSEEDANNNIANQNAANPQKDSSAASQNQSEDDNLTSIGKVATAVAGVLGSGLGLYSIITGSQYLSLKR